MVFPTHIVAAGALVTNEKGEVLLVNNPVRGWEFPGGQVENGEDLIEGITREVFEESGIEIKVEKMVAVYSNTKSYLGWDNETFVPTKVIFDFLATAIGGELKTSSESLDVGWFTKEFVIDMIKEPWLKDRVKKMIEYKGEVSFMAYSARPYEIYRQCNI